MSCSIVLATVVVILKRALKLAAGGIWLHWNTPFVDTDEERMRDLLSSCLYAQRPRPIESIRRLSPSFDVLFALKTLVNDPRRFDFSRKSCHFQCAVVRRWNSPETPLSWTSGPLNSKYTIGLPTLKPRPVIGRLIADVSTVVKMALFCLHVSGLTLDCSF